MTNLVTSFIESETVIKGNTLAAAIHGMNQTLSTSYTHSRIREWERGDRDPTPRAMEYMLSVVLPVCLAREGINKERITSILRECSLPQDEENRIYLDNIDTKKLLDVLDNPPAPSAKLKSAANRYRKK